MGDTSHILGRLAAALCSALAVVAVTAASNLDAIGGYTHHAFNITAFAGEDVNLDFSVSENAGRQTSFVIDDTALRVK